MNARAPMSRPRLADQITTVEYVASFRLGDSIDIDAHRATYELTRDHEGGIMATLIGMNIGGQRCGRIMLVRMFGEAEVLANETAAEEWAVDRKEMLYDLA